MTSFEPHFGPFDGHLWLNCAHQGPLPKVAVRAAQLALEEKVAPHRLPEEAFSDTPRRLKQSLGALIGVPVDQIILGNSTAYGLNLLVQGLRLAPGDEVLLIDGDFPSTVITWLPLRKRGINVRLFRPKNWPPSAEEIAQEISKATRVLCCSWVFSFFGAVVDLATVGALCRDRGVLFVVNGSQAIGGRDIDVSRVPIDALVSCGFKWQCGPYGTGFAWINPDILENFTYKQAYWLAHGGARSTAYELRDDIGASAYDVFGTANFLSFRTWTASLELLLDFGIKNIEDYDNDLVTRLVTGLQSLGYQLVSPTEGPSRSNLVLFTHKDMFKNDVIKAALEERHIHVAEREGKLRISPHLYNTPHDIDRALDVLTAFV